jgi:hypothetical protein
MNNLIQNYEIIFTHLNNLNLDFSDIRQIRTPKLGNLELIALSLTSEYMSIDSESQLFRCLSGTYLESKIERTVYNRRRKKLFFHMERIRAFLVELFQDIGRCFIIDSMPLEICKNSRMNRLKICKEEYQTAPAKGYCASQDTYYYGYKLHAVCSTLGVFQSIDITKANVHDIHYLQDIKEQMSDCTIIGDKAYLSANVQLDLFSSAHINLQVPNRENQLEKKPYPFVLKKARKRIETLFSQLCDQFMFRRNYAKTFQGFKTRILTKITSLTMIQYLNQFVFDRPLNRIKLNLS